MSCEDPTEWVDSAIIRSKKLKKTSMLFAPKGRGSVILSNLARGKTSFEDARKDIQQLLKKIRISDRYSSK